MFKMLKTNKFNTIKLKDTESIYAFNKRFNYLLQNVTGCGVPISEDKCKTVCLRALRQHPDSKILFEVKAMLKEHNQGVAEPLTDVQRKLLREEE